MKKVINFFTIILFAILMIVYTVVQFWPFLALLGLIAVACWMIHPVMMWIFVSPFILLLIGKVYVNIEASLSNKMCF